MKETEPGRERIEAYEDAIHGEDLAGLVSGDHGYKWRLLDGVVMPPYITPERYDLSRTLATQSGDLCFVSYPKSGSTWLSYVMLLLAHHGTRPEGDALRDNFHWVASSWPYPRSAEDLAAAPEPRIFKSHMPLSMALGGVPAENPCRYVYIARNPKDVVVSYYHFESGKKWSGDYSGPWEHWLELFLKGGVQRGDWFDHVLGWWSQRDAPNILFLKYEDLIRRFDEQVQRLGEFMGEQVTPELTASIREQTDFDRMSTESFSNLKEISELDSFFRKGQIGSWKNEFTVAQNERFDQIIAERLGGTGLDFEYE